jgi:hypothetical protein
MSMPVKTDSMKVTGLTKQLKRNQPPEPCPPPQWAESRRVEIVKVALIPGSDDYSFVLGIDPFADGGRVQV